MQPWVGKKAESVRLTITGYLHSVAHASPPNNIFPRQCSTISISLLIVWCGTISRMAPPLYLSLAIALFFSRAWDQMGQKRPIFGPNASFWAQNPILGEGVKLLVHLYQGNNETPLSCWKHWPVRLQLPAKDGNVQFYPEDLDIWGQNVME